MSLRGHFDRGGAIGVAIRALYGWMPWLYPLAETLQKARIVVAPALFLRDLRRYKKLEKDAGWRAHLERLRPILYDRYEAAGVLPRHYFHQDLWAARKVRETGTSVHYDFGSRIDGFIAHVLVFSDVRLFDVRPLAANVSGLSTIVSDILDGLPVPDESVSSLSSLHAVEHVGLGRYGDRLDPLGHEKALAELERILAPGGTLLLSLPVGRERLEFNAQRVIDPTRVYLMLPHCELVEFSVIDDEDRLCLDASPRDHRNAHYACGLFQFRKRREID